jgi:competence protein ComGC
MLKRSKGQTLIETILVVPVLLIIVFMIFWFARILLTRQQIQMAARYGTDLMVYTNMNEEQIKREIKDYLCTSKEGGRLLERDKIKINLKIDRFPEIRIDNAMDVLTQFFAPLDHTSFAEIGYTIATPRIFSAWDGYLGHTNIADSLTVSARSEVLAGTGYYEGGKTVDIPEPPAQPAARPEPPADQQTAEPSELPDSGQPGEVEPPTLGDVEGIAKDEAQNYVKDKINQEVDNVKQIFSAETARKVVDELKNQAVRAVEDAGIKSMFGF